MEFETESVRRQIDRSQHREHASPLYLTSSYTFETSEQARRLFAGEEEGYVYSRYANPNTTELIDKMIAMEGAEDGLATASGMAAVFASLAGLLRSGDHLVVCRSVFGSTHQIMTQILPRWGIDSTYVDIDKLESWINAFEDRTRMLFLETPTNPSLDVVDLEWAGRLAEKCGVILNVDNCFATPYLQQPIRSGASIVTHSTTKYLDG